MAAGKSEPEGRKTLCSVRALQLELGGRALLRDISLDITAGSRTAVMGPNGAGKSLLLRLLHGLIAPTSGAVQWQGFTDAAAARRAQAMVFQRPVVLRRSVAANIRFAQRAREVVDEVRLAALLEATQLTPYALQPARKLSGGEQQRLALARALATDPQVLFLDEPTANLDPASTRIIEDLVNSAHRGGTKIIFVTHDFHQVRRLADEVVFLSEGRLCEQTDTATFFDAPKSSQARVYLSGGLLP